MRKRLELSYIMNITSKHCNTDCLRFIFDKRYSGRGGGGFDRSYDTRDGRTIFLVIDSVPVAHLPSVDYLSSVSLSIVISTHPQLFLLVMGTIVRYDVNRTPVESVSNIVSHFLLHLTISIFKTQTKLRSVECMQTIEYRRCFTRCKSY